MSTTGKLDCAKRNFAAAMRRYIDSGTDVAGLALLVHKSERAIRRWCTLDSAPGRQEIKRICDILGWNYLELNSIAPQIDQVFAQTHLDFDALGRRLLSCMARRDGSGIKNIESQISARLYVMLNECGVCCQAVFNPNLEALMTFTQGGLAHDLLRIFSVTGKGAYAKWVRVFKPEEEFVLTQGLGTEKLEALRSPTYALTNEGSQVLLKALISRRDQSDFLCLRQSNEATTSNRQI